MKLKAKIVLKTPYYVPSRLEFYNPMELTDYLRQMESFFMQPHQDTHLRVGRPEFQLGICAETISDGVHTDSAVMWGPRFLVACRVRAEGKNLVATMPTDCARGRGDVVARTWGDAKISQHAFDAILDCGHMRQLWPPRRDNAKTELVRFLAQFARFKSKLQDKARG